MLENSWHFQKRSLWPGSCDGMWFGFSICSQPLVCIIPELCLKREETVDSMLETLTWHSYEQWIFPPICLICFNIFPFSPFWQYHCTSCTAMWSSLRYKYERWLLCWTEEGPREIVCAELSWRKSEQWVGLPRTDCLVSWFLTQDQTTLLVAG